MKKNKISMASFIIGVVLYLSGLFFLMVSTLSHTAVIHIANEADVLFRMIGIVLFTIGFTLFMMAVVYFYKHEKIRENYKDLIAEGKADVITIMIMTYIMVIMLVLCLLFDQLIGALLFGLTLFIQSILNSLLLRYFNKVNTK